jgi:hypothetical protein
MSRPESSNDSAKVSQISSTKVRQLASSAASRRSAFGATELVGDLGHGGHAGRDPASSHPIPSPRSHGANVANRRAKLTASLMVGLASSA